MSGTNDRDGDTSGPLDVVTIGRSSVDLYGQQIGSRLEDIGTFAKSVGGCPSNIAIGTARLGLKSAVITGVGDEPMGQFILEQMEREGVSRDGIKIDTERLTALVLLSVENQDSFPLIFYRENCADMGLNEDDVDPALIARSRSVLVTGTHFSQPGPAAAQNKVIDLAREAGAKVIFDIDYRPNLWGLAGHGAGEERYIQSENVSERLRPVLSRCDLIVGTEEEILIASGEGDVLSALRRIRENSAGTIVLKRGPMGCVVFPDAIPDQVEEGIAGPGYPVDVFNVLGAGDGFMSGFLRGWLRDEPLETCAAWANACGAIVVSRLLCSPEIPTWAELQHFMEHGSSQREMRRDETLNHIHWATTRRKRPDALKFLYFHHRVVPEVIADRNNQDVSRFNTLKRLAAEAAVEVSQGREGFGLMIDDRLGREAIPVAARGGLWINRIIGDAYTRPLHVEMSQDGLMGITFWPLVDATTCFLFYHADDPPGLKARQIESLAGVYSAVRAKGHELFVQFFASGTGMIKDDTYVRCLTDIYEYGLKPDWWILELQPSSDAWRAIGEVIKHHDEYCRGVLCSELLPNLDEDFAYDMDSFLTGMETACQYDFVRGFAAGTPVFAEPAQDWMAGRIDDETARAQMAERFGQITNAWDKWRR